MKLSLLAIALSCSLLGCSNQSIAQQEQIEQLQKEIKQLKEEKVPVIAIPTEKKENILILTEDDKGYEGSIVQKHFESYYDQCVDGSDYYFVKDDRFNCSTYESAVDLIGRLKYGNFENNLSDHKKGAASCSRVYGDTYKVNNQTYDCFDYNNAMNMIKIWNPNY